MHGIDPYDPSDPTYECRQCGTRSETRGTCPDCDGPLLNITVPRE